MKITTFDQALEVLDSYIKPVVFAPNASPHLKDPLDRMHKLLELLDNPQYTFKSVLIAGTSGKGSTSYLLSHILTTAGYKTGYTLSPHLQRITERIQINEQEISKPDFVQLVNQVVPIAEKMKAMEVGEPSHFEVLIAMAFLYFAKQKVDIAVVEVGLGGRLDATNTLFPYISVITNISLDHTAILGNTIEEIAKEKAGIIKKNRELNKPRVPIVVTGVKQPSVIQIIDEKSREVGTHVFRSGKDFHYKTINTSENGSEFSFWEKGYPKTSFFLSLPGAFQVENAVLALESVFHLVQFGFPLSDDHIVKAFKTAFVPGRFELIHYKSEKARFEILLDGAHNPEKMQAFLGSVEKVFSNKRKLFVIGFTEGKNIEKMVGKLVQMSDTFILTQFNKTTYIARQHGADVKNIESIIKLKSKGKKVLVITIDSVSEALKKAMSLTQNSLDNLIVVTGSLYLVGEARDFLNPHSESQTSELR